MNFTTELSTALCLTDEPLTSRQARELEAIARDSGINRGDTDRQAGWDAFIEQSRAILSQKQLGALMAVADRSAWLRAQHEWIRAYDKTSTQSK